MSTAFKSLPRSLAFSALIGLTTAACGNNEVLTPNLTSYDFGKVFVGTTAVSSKVQWTNKAAGEVEVIGIPATPQGPINLSPSSKFKAVKVAAGQKTPAVTFSFAPDQAKRFTETGTPLIGSHGAQGQAKGIELKGEGAFQIVGGDLIVTAGDLKAGKFLDFGKVQVPNARAVRRKFSLANLGDKDIKVRPVWSKGKLGFDLVTPSAPITVPAKKSIDVILRFKPAKAGEVTDAVKFVDVNDARNFAGSSVRGEGVKRPGSGEDE